MRLDLHHSHFLFCGMRTELMTIDLTSEQIAVTRFNNPVTEYMKGCETLEMSMVMFGQFPDKLLDVWNGQPDYNMIMLGKGHVCRYCGTYSVAGCLKCGKCGAPTGEFDFAKVGQFPFFLTSLSVDAQWGLDPGECKVSVDMIMQSDPKDFDIDLLMGATIEHLPSGYRLNEGLYVCQYCGNTVEDGHGCPSCGGHRIPWREVVRMDDRNCVYCGNRTTGLVCPGCGHALGAMAYAGMKGQGWYA